MTRETGDSNLTMNFAAMAMSAAMMSAAMMSAAMMSVLATPIWVVAKTATVLQVAMVPVPKPVSGAAARL